MKQHLDKIRQRLQSATPGPLTIRRFEDDHGSVDTYVFDHRDECMLSDAPYDETTCNLTQGDFELFANAQFDISKLLRVVEVLSEGLEAIAGLDEPNPPEPRERLYEASSYANEAIATAEKILGEGE